MCLNTHDSHLQENSEELVAVEVSLAAAAALASSGSVRARTVAPFVLICGCRDVRALGRPEWSRPGERRVSLTVLRGFLCPWRGPGARAAQVGDELSKIHDES